MKLKITFFILILGIINIPTNLSAQANRIITLEVNTQNVTQGNLEETCKFVGQTENETLKEFTEGVEIGDLVLWQGKANPGNGDLVRITEYIHNSGASLMGRDTIRDPQGTGVVVGRVQEGFEPGAEDTYFLKFEVKKRGSTNWEPFEIDPKLRLNNE